MKYFVNSNVPMIQKQLEGLSHDLRALIDVIVEDSDLEGISGFYEYQWTDQTYTFAELLHNCTHIVKTRSELMALLEEAGRTTITTQYEYKYDLPKRDKFGFIVGVEYHTFWAQSEMPLIEWQTREYQQERYSTVALISDDELLHGDRLCVIVRFKLPVGVIKFSINE